MLPVGSCYVCECITSMWKQHHWSPATVEAPEKTCIYMPCDRECIYLALSSYWLYFSSLPSSQAQAHGPGGAASLGIMQMYTDHTVIYTQGKIAGCHSALSNAVKSCLKCFVSYFSHKNKLWLCILLITKTNRVSTA